MLDLITRYENETGMSAYRNFSMTVDYTEWLEDLVNKYYNELVKVKPEFKTENYESKNIEDCQKDYNQFVDITKMVAKKQ